MNESIDQRRIEDFRIEDVRNQRRSRAMSARITS
jgi:hypothetical protein